LATGQAGQGLSREGLFASQDKAAIDEGA